MPENKKKTRGNLAVMGRLVGLVKPLAPVMVAAVLLGVAGFLCAIFITVLGAYALLDSILPGMLLHLVNNTLAFLTIYLRYYAPAELSFGVELFILLFFPVFGGWMIWNARSRVWRAF